MPTKPAKAKKPVKPKERAKGMPKSPKIIETPQGELKQFPIDMLKFETMLQPRKGDASTPVGGLYEFHVEDLRESIRKGDKLPPIRVFAVAGRGNVVTRGHHRTEAYRREGRKQVPVEFFPDKTWLEAVVDANQEQEGDSTSPLKRDHEAKRQAVLHMLQILRDGGKSWTNRKIAAHTGTSDDLVAKMILRMAPQVSPPTTEPAKPVVKEGKDGKQYKEPVKKPKASNPDPPKPPAIGTDATPSRERPPLDTPPARVFDLHKFETEVGATYRQIDNLGATYSVMHGTRTEGLRRLLQEFKAEFVKFHEELEQTRKGK